MKICMLTDAWLPVWGGGQEHIWQVSKILVQKYGYQVDILVPNIVDTSGKGGKNREQYLQGKLRLLRLGPRFVFPNLIGRSVFLAVLLKYLLTHKYAIYHSHANAAILLPLIKIFQSRSKVIYTLHGAGVDMLGAGLINRTRLPMKVWKLLVEKYPFDALLSVASATLPKVAASKIMAVVGNGVNISEFDKVKTEKKGHFFKIIWVGRLEPVKGLIYLVRAIKMLVTEHSNIQIHIYGSGPLKDKLIQEVALTKLNKTIFFHLPIYGSNKIKIFKSSDLYVLPSLSEGLPLTLLEAMAAKLPVIASDVGDISTVLKNKVSGYLVKPGDKEELTTKIDAALNNTELKKMGEAGYQTIRNRYTWDRVVNRVMKTYNSGLHAKDQT